MDGSAECCVSNKKVVKGEKEKVESVKERGAECCGSDKKVVKGEKEKEKRDSGVVTVGGSDSSDSQCGGNRHISKETLNNIRKHLGDGRGECCGGVVVFECC